MIIRVFTPNGGVMRKTIPLFQGNPGWWNIFLLSANKSQFFLDPALDHVDSTNDFLFTALGIRLPRLREQDMRELSLLFKGVRAPMLDALERHIGNFQLDGLVPADMVMAGCIRGGAPNRIYLPMMPRMNDGAPLPPLFTERLRAACQSPLNSNSVLALLCLSCSLLVFCGLHVSFLRAFGRARKLTGSDSPIFTTLEGLKTPKKASAQVVTPLERLLVSVPGSEGRTYGNHDWSSDRESKGQEEFSSPRPRAGSCRFKLALLPRVGWTL